MNKSFTLIEILVVIVVIGVLSSFIFIGMSSISQKANFAKGQVFLNLTDNALLIGRVSQWKLDQVNGTNLATTLDAWGSNTGTLYDGASTACFFGGSSTVCPQPVTSGCPSGNCLSFDGSNDYVNCGSDTSLNLSDNIFTISAWIKTNNSGSWKWIYQFGEHSSNKDRSLTINSSNKATLYVYGNNAVGITSVTDNVWYYIVGTSNGTTIRIYVNGNSENTATPTFSAYAYLGTRIGRNGDGSYSFNGLIDDVRIYNQAIPTSEIQQNYFIGINNLYKNNGITLNEFNQRLVELKNNIGSID